MKFRDTAFRGFGSHAVPIGAAGFVVFGDDNVADVNGMARELLASQPSRFACVREDKDGDELELPSGSESEGDEPRPRRRGRLKRSDSNE